MNELELKQENQKLKETIEKMADEIFIEYNPHFVSPEAVISFYMDSKPIKHCTGSSYAQDHCREEKRGCKGCNYYRKD